MSKINLKPAHKVVQEYYAGLEKFKHHNVTHELAVKLPFQNILESCGRQLGWTFIAEHKHKNRRLDGAFRTEDDLVRGYWEAKDEKDDLRKEIKKKFSEGYPTDNIIFQKPTQAILIQNKKEVIEADLTKPENLVRVLEMFFDYRKPEDESWEQAKANFRDRISEYGEALALKIKKERVSNKRFLSAFADFYELCRQSINPNLSENAVEEMLIQHLLTERIFRTVFRNPDFTRRNVIASEIEKVVDALTSQSFSRADFLKQFDYFYRALEQTADTIDDFAQKQEFLNTVYERFFQGFSVKVADTHGIVYTPQPIVDFMVRSVEEILQKEFGKSLSSDNVHILDPFVGTGNFMVRVMREMKRTSLEQKYRGELHCNEVMLLPYYIASLNIEHEYYTLTNDYIPFEGICLVDTFELAEHAQGSFSYMIPANTQRVERQKQSPIFVCIGNPPYNVGQLNENDNNKNRKYKELDKRVAETYARDSKATLKTKLSDVYVKSFRWASDQIKKTGEGIVAFVTNNSYLENFAFDGMRKHLTDDFDTIYLLDLGGNVRKNPKLSGTTHNVFGIQVGVCVGIFIKHKEKTDKKVFYARVEELWKKEQKYKFLEEHEHYGKVEWKEVVPDAKSNWLNEGMQNDFEGFTPLGNKTTKSSKNIDVEAIFKTYALGVSTNRDNIVYDFNKFNLLERINNFVSNYNLEVLRYTREGKPKNVDDFLDYSKVKWSLMLKDKLRRGRFAEFDANFVRTCLYRPFTKRYLYLDKTFVDAPTQQLQFFPPESENFVISVTDIGSRSLFSTLMADNISDLHLCASTDGFQCFPFYVYSDDGLQRKENITEWSLNRFRSHYKDSGITKLDIFHYVYAVLHSNTYSSKYSVNLKRELPRIPLAPDFAEFVKIGAELADLHLHYETAKEFPLERVENPAAEFSWRVEKMRLSRDRTVLRYNDFLTLRGIPPETFEYKLGNRSALEWIVEQYQVTTDPRSGIVNDPNRPDDPQYILKLIGQVINVSLATVHRVKRLSSLPLE